MAERGVTVRLSVADGFSAQLRNFAAAIDNAEKKTKAFGATAGLMGDVVGEGLKAGYKASLTSRLQIGHHSA